MRAHGVRRFVKAAQAALLCAAAACLTPGLFGPRDRGGVQLILAVKADAPKLEEALRNACRSSRRAARTSASTARPSGRAAKARPSYGCFTLRPEAAARFGAWTGANQGRYLAVMLNGRVRSAPYIRGQITDTGQISGNFTRQQAEDLALTLRSGDLPAPVEVLEEGTYKP